MESFTKDGRTRRLLYRWIHTFLKASQLMETMRKHFPDYEDLVLTTCKTEKFSTDLKWEPSEGKIFRICIESY